MRLLMNLFHPKVAGNAPEPLLTAPIELSMGEIEAIRTALAVGILPAHMGQDRTRCIVKMAAIGDAYRAWINQHG